MSSYDWTVVGLEVCHVVCFLNYVYHHHLEAALLNRHDHHQIWHCCMNLLKVLDGEGSLQIASWLLQLMVLCFVHQPYKMSLDSLCLGHFAVPPSAHVQVQKHHPGLASEAKAGQGLSYAPTSSNCEEMLQVLKVCFQ
jgi:hypothetical protein